MPGLNPSDRFLDGFRKTLNAETDAGDAARCERHRPIVRKDARVDLDRHVRFFAIERENQPVHEADKIHRCNRIGAAAAECDVSNLASASQPVPDALDLGFERFEIAGKPVGAVGGSRIAPAIPADRLTIWDVDINRERRVPLDGSQCLRHVGRADTVVEFDGRRIARIARYGALEQLGIIAPHAARASIGALFHP